MVLLVGLMIPLSLAALIGVRAARGASRYLTPPRATVGEPPSFARPVQTVTFRTTDGVNLEGWWVAPANGAAVVFVHGMGQSRANWVEEARWLTDAGFGVLLFDLRAHGRSGGEVSTGGDKEVLDADAALAFARAQPGVERLGAVGFSIGASALAASAVKRGDLGAVILMAPFTTIRESIASDFAARGVFSVKPAEWALEHAGVDLDTLRPIDDIAKLKAKPLLVMGGDRETDPPMMNRIIAAAQPEAQTWLVIGAEHGQYRQVAPDEYKRRVMSLLSVLSPGP
jgi:pimeloyl-ACP methyl ester carboxylesterase